MASGSVYGQTGPLAKEWGVDGTGGALSGRTFLTGWPDRDPVVPGAVPYGDVIVPFVMASAIAMALQFRREHVASACISMRPCTRSASSKCIRPSIDAQLGKTPHRMGNADPKVLFQDVFPAQGDDRWVAISCFNEADLARLTEIVGGDDIAAWTRDRKDLEAVDLLQDRRNCRGCCPGYRRPARARRANRGAGVIGSTRPSLPWQVRSCENAYRFLARYSQAVSRAGHRRT